MIGKERRINFSEKKCKSCGNSYKIVPQVIPLFGKTLDKSFQIPDCNCQEIEEERKAKKILGQKIAAKIRRLKDCGINSRFKGKTFSNFKKARDPNAYNICRDYARTFKENKKESLMLTGPAGTGKTHLAVATVDYIARLKHKLLKRIIFVTVPDMVEMVRRKLFIDPKILKKDIYKDSLLECDLLVLDDLGAESMTDWTKDLVHQLIDFRYRENLPIVITTNLTLDKVKKLYGERVFSRIYEMCQGIELSGSDYRLGD